MPKTKIETQISSDAMKSVNDIGGIVWAGVFAVIVDLDKGTVFSGEEASKVAGACRKAAERALTKLLSTPVSTEPSNATGEAEPSKGLVSPAYSSDPKASVAAHAAL